MIDQIQKTTVITVYSAGVAACYLAGFWGRFDVNIFQFAGLTGFASLALYPLMTALGLNLLAGLVAPLGQRNQAATRPPHKEGVWHRFLKKLYAVWFALGPLSAIAAISFAPYGIKWVLSLTLMAPWINWLASQPLAMQLVPGRFRLETVYWLVALPVLAAQLGTSHAQDFFDGHETRTVAPAGAARDLQWDSKHPIGYLGFAGGTYFLFESKTGNVVMVNQAVAAPLILQPRPRQTAIEWLHSAFHDQR